MIYLDEAATTKPKKEVLDTIYSYMDMWYNPSSLYSPAQEAANALKSAKISINDVDYVNLHGTGTKFNDSMEGKAVAAVFAGYKVPCSTTKPMTGHTLGAAGALEAAVCYNAIVNNAGKSEGEIKLPVQVWDKIRDEEIPELNIVNAGEKSDCKKVRICMSNSFAFGGANSSLIIGCRG